MLTLHKLKNAVRRASALLGAASLLAGIAASAIPASVFADALNPLTERSLTLSSSSPGWSYLDGSGNTTYAYPNSGANGQKTGNTFQFRVSSPSASDHIKAITFQYCTEPAGDCIAPGDNTTDSHDVDDTHFTTADGTGHITLNSGDDGVTGSGTSFDAELNVGATIVTAGGNVYTVASIDGPADLTLTANATATEDGGGSGVAFKYRKADTATSSDLNIVMPSETLINSGDWANISAGGDDDPAYTPEANGDEGEFVALTEDAAGTSAGTVATDDATNVVTGTGTSFKTVLKAGSKITIGANTYTVASITDDTHLTITAANAAVTVSGATMTYTNTGPAEKYTSATDWAVTATNAETGTIADGTATGKNNMIVMTSSTGITLDTQDYMKVIFYGTTANYITNPGSGSFFVRINTYSDFTAGSPPTVDAADVIDGGVTVANVMNESITIQTKVLETMAFSVGTFDPDKYDNTVLASAGIADHGQCSTLLMADPTSGTYATDPHNVIRLGTEENDYSLSTTKAYDGFSYWRLSSNSSGGATVYYTGHTLTNTENDEIMPMDETPGGTPSRIGNEQFGLGIATDDDHTLLGDLGANDQTYPTWEGGGTLYTQSYGDLDTGDDNDFSTTLFDAYTTAGFSDPDPMVNVVSNDSFAHYPRLYPLVPVNPYGDDDGNISGTAAGSINASDNLDLAGGVTNTAKFAFSSNADTYARPIATEPNQVVNCVTAKMRYIANIAATTPAGLYTTKINYVAAPQY